MKGEIGEEERVGGGIGCWKVGLTSIVEARNSSTTMSRNN